MFFKNLTDLSKCEVCSQTTSTLHDQAGRRETCKLSADDAPVREQQLYIQGRDLGWVVLTG